MHGLIIIRRSSTQCQMFRSFGVLFPWKRITCDMISVRSTCSAVNFFKPSCRFNSTTSLTKIPTLFGDEISPPVRFVLMTAFHLGIDMKFHKIDLFLGENKTEFYTKINPQQKVPALDTGKVVIRDSHAIALYLCRQTANDLYPEETSLRAKVEELLFFNSSHLFPVDSSIFTDYFSGKLIEETKVETWHKSLDILENHLNSHSWLTGTEMALCDLCCAATVSSLEVLVPLTNRHPRVNEWLKSLEQLPCFDVNVRGVQRLRKLVRQNKLL